MRHALMPLALLACLEPSPLDTGDAAPSDAEASADDTDLGHDDTDADDTPPDPEDTDTDGSDDTDDTDDTDTDAADTDAPDTDLPAPTPAIAQRVIVMGDSWSTGFAQPLREALDAEGYTAGEVSWEITAAAGSKAEDWVANEHAAAITGGPDLTRPRLLDALDQELAAQPPPDVLFLVLGGNDMNAKIDDGLGDLPGFLQDLAFDAIRDDLAFLVDRARAAQPNLDVVLVGYDWLHEEFLDLTVMDLSDYDTRSYNEALLELETRKKDLAASRDRVWYAHNLGLLQHLHGDTIHPPFSIPNPLAGYPEYGPGLAPAPGWAPTYQPFPGGLISYPGPLAHIPDGIHPSGSGFRDLADHVLDQGMANLLDGYDWLGTQVLS